MEKVDDISASIREIENGLRKSKDRMARTKSTIIPRVKQFDALYLDSQVTTVYGNFKRVCAKYQNVILITGTLHNAMMCPFAVCSYSIF